jgi:hypothetical protein
MPRALTKHRKIAKIGYFKIEIGNQKQNQSKYYDTQVKAKTLKFLGISRFDHILDSCFVLFNF